jgi:DNA-binding MarR family transcriptional regulator
MSRVPLQPRDETERAEVVDDLIDALRLFTVESDVFVDVFARAHGLGRSDLNAIMWISTGTQTGRPMTVGELAVKLGLGAPATTALVDRLEAAGHVQRTRDPADRRKVVIVMQPPALEVAREFFIPLGRLMTEAVKGTASDELRRTTAVVRRLITAVTEAREAANGARTAPRSAADRPT